MVALFGLVPMGANKGMLPSEGLISKAMSPRPYSPARRATSLCASLVSPTKEPSLGARSLKQAVVGKYGPPTFRDADTAGSGRAEHDEWCTPVASAGAAPKDCDAAPHVKYTNDDATIELADPGLQQRIAKKLDEVPKEKPKP